MLKQLSLHCSDFLSLQTFTVFSEYFLSVSILSALVVVILTLYNTHSLKFEWGLTECFVLILFMSVLLIFNDDLLTIQFLSFNNSIISDYASFAVKILICGLSTLYLSMISDYWRIQRLISFEYLLIIVFSIVGLMLMCSSNDFLITYLSMELSSLAFYVMSAFKKWSSYSVESGVKYFVTGAIASALFLLGSSFIYGSTGSIYFSDYQILFGYTGAYFDPYQFFSCDFLELGVMLLLFSLFIKLALAPFHLWALDVYEGSPTSSTFFFAVITKLSVFLLMIRLCYQSFFSLKIYWQFSSLIIGVFSIFVGSFGGLIQRRLKTLLAYSSTSHMGYLLIIFSSGTFGNLQMLFFYKVVYMLSSLAIWYIVLLLQLKTADNLNPKHTKELSDLILLNKSNPALAFLFIVLMFSIAGIPPLVGFIAKMCVFLSAINSSFYLISLTIIFCSVVSTFYYIWVLKIVYFENAVVGKLYCPIATTKTLVLSNLIFLLIFFFIDPNLLYLVNYKVLLGLF